jgi:predicted nucleic acid-binding protein
VAKYKRPCLDSSVFLGGLNGEIINGLKRGVVFNYLWGRAKSGDFKVLISALTLAEVYKTKRSATPESPVLDEFLEKIEEHFIEVIEIDRETGLEAHALCRRYAANKLYPGDAFHLACASRAGCDVLLAWDGPLVSIGSYKSVRIEEPAIFDRNLFTESEIASPEEIAEYTRNSQKLALAQDRSKGYQGKGAKAGTIVN